MSRIEVVILAAGMGTRLGTGRPKALTLLADGRTILEQQVANIRLAFGARARISVVVGFKCHLVMEHLPQANFIYNDDYDVTNTNRSLLRALRLTAEGPVVWMNGDVVFDSAVLTRLLPLLDEGRNVVAVNSAKVADEEVKYTVDPFGMIASLSKEVSQERACGEAVGINLVSPQDRRLLIERLAQCQPQDYFERGVELAIERDSLRFTPVDISDLYAVEVDTTADLALARAVDAAHSQSQTTDLVLRQTAVSGGPTISAAEGGQWHRETA